MSDHQPASHAIEVLPTCTKCRVPMALKRLRAGRSFSYVGNFECETCGRIVTEAIKLRVTSGPALASTPAPSLSRGKRRAVEMLSEVAIAAAFVLILQ
jgi:hypothetical protein